MDIKNIDDLSISKYINCLREFFLTNNFCEIALFDTTSYCVTNTNQIQTSTGSFLRYTTEPDIWQRGLEYDKFFCITSLFRNENASSLLHKNEFKIVDFYIKNSNEEKILDTFFKALEFLEERLCLPKLSKLNLQSCDFDEFNKANNIIKSLSILMIKNYPLDESFYDVIDEKTGKTKKSELFFGHNEQPIEFSVFGQVDENKNPLNKIENFRFKNPNIKTLNLFGMCLGIERTIMCYNILIKSKIK